ncbi:3-phytase [Sphingopyxis lindanitolerans]|uniref:3-phytase n=1 Tax=Sphingopyxis lindanitolerans TaxID=2054227 RepID=A0A2S8B8V8_9SPHN|nr:phytase [Sphingopyxis lindanitolerans]PQM28854.1 3-phytase [Sphingopyxis lindanitolerans]
MKTSLFAIAAALGTVPAAAAAQDAAALPAVAAAAETEATQGSGADGAVVVADPGDPSRTLILAGAESAGIEVFDLAGHRVATHKVGNIRALDLRADAAPGGAPLLAALDGKANAPKLFRVGAGGVPAPLALTGIEPAMTVAGLCFSRSHRDGALYLFLVGDKGEIEQWGLAADASGALSGRIARRWSLGSEIGYCAADDRGSVYFSQEAIGVWRFAAEPEAEIKPEIVDIVRLGHITDEAKGVAIAADGRLLVSDASADRLNIYDPAADHAYLGSVTLAAGADKVEDAGSVTLAGPVVVVADDDNAPEQPNFKVAHWPALLAAAGLPERPAAPAPATMPLALATVETVPVETGGDAADDPAIWINPADPAQSVVIGTQKQSGLYVYGLDGKVLQYLPDGRMNNVDLRSGFRLGGRDVTLVTASNRTTKGISIYALDPATRKLTDVADGLQDTGFADPYGLCMYRSAKTKKSYVFVNQTDGKMRQWELVATPAGKVRATLVRDLPFASQVEGCVADDEAGMLYTGEEDVGIWREGADPRGGPARTMLAKIADNPALKDDMEGMGLYAMAGGKGYLVVSSQGNDSYAVFRREGDNAYVGSFRIGADMAAGIDGVSETDGLDVSSLAAGPNFPHGLMVAQDGRNVSPPENQNFKLVPWERVAKALGLDL